MERKRYIDIAKGILILFVVYAHAPIQNFEPINWFHMPAFLILSGYTFNMPQDIGKWLKVAAKRLLIPYASFYSINVVLMLSFVSGFTFPRLIRYIGGGILSGRFIPGVFWFITCFFLMQIIFTFLNSAIKNKKIIIAIIIGLYILAHIISLQHYERGVYEMVRALPMLPWNIDVVPMMMVYFAIGFYGKNILTKIMDKMNIYYVLVLGVVAGGFYWANFKFDLNYWINMKYARFNFWILDIVVPVVFSLLIIGISKLIEKFKVTNLLAIFGMYTFPVMYLHLPITDSLNMFMPVEPTLFMAISIVAALVFIVLIKKNKYMNFFFNGKGSFRELFLERKI